MLHLIKSLHIWDLGLMISRKILKCEKGKEGTEE